MSSVRTSRWGGQCGLWGAVYLSYLACAACFEELTVRMLSWDVCGVIHMEDTVTIVAGLTFNDTLDLKTKPQLVFQYQPHRVDYWVTLCSVYIQKPSHSLRPGSYGCVVNEFSIGDDGVGKFKATLHQMARLHLDRVDLRAGVKPDHRDSKFKVVRVVRQDLFPYVFQSVHVTFTEGDTEYILETSSRKVDHLNVYHGQCDDILEQRSDAVFTPDTGIGRQEVTSKRRPISFCVSHLVKFHELQIRDLSNPANSRNVNNTECVIVEEAVVLATKAEQYIELRYVERRGCLREAYFCFTVDVQTAGASHVTSHVTVTWWGVLLAAILFDGI